MMKAPTRIVPSALKIFAGTALTALTSIALASPLGYLQIDGRISVQPDGANAAVPISENAYTLFSNDRIDTSHGSAVLVLNGGGVIGLSKGSSASIRQSEGDNSLSVSLERGSIAYSIPGNTRSLRVSVDEVQFEAVGAGEAAGTLSVNENRQVNAIARTGDIRVLHAAGAGVASTAGAIAPAAATGSANQAMTAQSFDTLTSISQGGSAQVQTAGTVSVSAVAMANETASLASDTAIGSAPASASAQVVDGNMAFVQSAQGSTLVVIDDPGDNDLQSVSP